MDAFNFFWSSINEHMAIEAANNALKSRRPWLSKEFGRLLDRKPSHLARHANVVESHADTQHFSASLCPKLLFLLYHQFSISSPAYLSSTSPCLLFCWHESLKKWCRIRSWISLGHTHLVVPVLLLQCLKFLIGSVYRTDHGNKEDGWD